MATIKSAIKGDIAIGGRGCPTFILKVIKIDFDPDLETLSVHGETKYGEIDILLYIASVKRSPDNGKWLVLSGVEECGSARYYSLPLSEVPDSVLNELIKIR